MCVFGGVHRLAADLELDRHGLHHLLVALETLRAVLVTDSSWGVALRVRHVGVGDVSRKAAASAAASAAARQLSSGTRNLGLSRWHQWRRLVRAWRRARRVGRSSLGMRAGSTRARAARRPESLVEERFIAICVDRGTWVACSRWRERVGGSDEGEKIVMSS